MKINNKRMISDKKGISIMIAYILLIVFAIIIGAIVFQWLGSFVPSEGLQCPDGTSLLINEATFNSADDILTIRLKNNGRFNIGVYFIHVSNTTEDDIPTINIAPNITSGNFSAGSVFFYGSGENPFSPGQSAEHTFNLSDSGIGTPIKVSIIPAREQVVDDVKRLVSCSGSRVELLVNLLTGLLVFISGQGRTYQGDYFSGLSGADAECNDMASEGDLNGTYVAWLSTDTVNAADRITDNFYVLVDGTIVANSKADLLNGSLLAPINLDQNGTVRSGRTWTGTNISGVSTGIDCDNWTSGLGSLDGTRGDPSASNNEWTNSESVACNEESRIYCFQTE